MKGGLFNPPYTPYKISCDFMAQTQYQPNFYGDAIASGTMSYGTGTSKHPGVLTYKSSVNANSGYKYFSLNLALLLAGSEKCTFIFKTPANLTGITRQMGFHDSLTEVAPVDGVYCKMIDTTLTGHTSSNGTASTTGTNYTIEVNTWYRLVVGLNADATLAIFKLYADDSDTILWTDTLATNIPTAANRNVGVIDNCTYSGTSAIEIGYIDYIDIILPKARRVN